MGADATQKELCHVQRKPLQSRRRFQKGRRPRHRRIQRLRSPFQRALHPSIGSWFIKDKTACSKMFPGAASEDKYFVFLVPLKE
jgi:hypothetical protein